MSACVHSHGAHHQRTAAPITETNSTSSRHVAGVTHRFSMPGLPISQQQRAAWILVPFVLCGKGFQLYFSFHAVPKKTADERSAEVAQKNKQFAFLNGPLRRLAKLPRTAVYVRRSPQDESEIRWNFKLARILKRDSCASVQPQ